MEQNFQDIYEQLQSRIRQAEDKRLQLKAKGTKNGLIAGGITLVARSCRQPDYRRGMAGYPYSMYARLDRTIFLHSVQVGRIMCLL